MTPYFCLRQLKRICLLSFFYFPLLWSDPTILQTLRQAERLFSEELYSDALPLYSLLLNLSIDEEIKNQLTLRLASCYLEENNPQTALHLLSPITTNCCRHQGLYLMSLAYRKLGKASEALKMLQQCQLIPFQPIHHLIALEEGYHYTFIKEFSKAKNVLNTILWDHHAPLPYYLAQLYLAKIDLITHQYDSALQTLTLLSEKLPSQHPLDLEITYLLGWLSLAQHAHSQSITYFEELLDKTLSSKSNVNGSIQALIGLIIGYLRQAFLIKSSPDELHILLSKTEAALQQLLALAPIESSYLLLTDFLFIKAKFLGDLESYREAQQLLERKELFSSEKGILYTLLKRAEAAPSYDERQQLCKQLLSHSDYPHSFRIKVWFLKGLNDFEEALKMQKSEIKATAADQFEQAADSFDQIVQIGKDLNPRELALALKYLALAYAYQSKPEKSKQAWQSVNLLLEDRSLLTTFEYPQEIECLSAWIALSLSDQETLQKARKILQTPQTHPSTNDKWETLFLKLEGLICLQLKEWKEADLLFTRLLHDYPHSFLKGEAWFWRAYGADQQNQISLKKEYLKEVYTQDPESPYAPIAYFQLYSYRDYMKGQSQAIKHLQTMPVLFPSHPLLIHAFYLMGMYHKKDLLSEQGQILRRKDWTAAIEAFELAETTFDTLLEKQLISPMEIPYLAQVRYRAQLERAQANLAIAQSSIGGKRLIYLEYAEGVFKQLIKDFNTPLSLAQTIVKSDPYPKIWAEAEFKLAQTYEEKKSWAEAEEMLNRSLEHFRQIQQIQGYGLMRVWIEKGKLAQHQSHHQSALDCFLEAEKVNRDFSGLSPNEKLDLWIQQSLCYKTLRQLESAMRLLSRVINDSVISPLRIKAMFLRAEIYELQGRSELAIKQLEATARQGGEWSKKAEEKLKDVYGY